MPKLSLWRDGRHSNDYRFFDKNIAEYMNASGTGVHVHKYLGPIAQPDSTDLSQPSNTTQSELNIQDLLFLENRDRKYEENVYSLRGCYQVADNSFDLSQFGLFLQTGTLYMTFHLTEMVNNLGRKLMNGDVLELMHLVDYDTLNPDLPAALKRFFVISDCTRGAEGYSPTWWPHIWRCKLSPLVDSQEYRDILNKITVSEDSNTPLREIMSTYNTYTQINDAVVAQAELDLPKSGYDVSPIYHVSSDANTPDYSVSSYLGNTDTTPNGENYTQGVAFPSDPAEGDYCLRVDFVPNRLFRYNGARWRKIEDKVRTNLTNNSTENLTQRNSFITNTRTFTDTNGVVQTEKQSLHDALKPRAD